MNKLGEDMCTWIQRFDSTGVGPRVAVKDAIDVAGSITTMGCRAIAETGTPANKDAACVARIRASGARIVGKTNLHELCYGGTGVNTWYGTPVNPLDRKLVPGGSSSGSAVAVARYEADIALGTDTGGSVRIPAACCGIVGLKTTWGRISSEGVWHLAPSLDTVGPLARDVQGIRLAMELLEPGFKPSEPVTRLGRLRLNQAETAYDTMVDQWLRDAGFDVVDVRAAGWTRAHRDFLTILGAEAWSVLGHVLTNNPDRVGRPVARLLREGSRISPDALREARSGQELWRTELANMLSGVSILALPTMSTPPMKLSEVGVNRRYLASAPRSRQSHLAARGKGDMLSLPPVGMLTRPFNLAGVPALSLPLRGSAHVPVSLQLVASHGGEELLCGVGAVFEDIADVHMKS